LNGDKVLSQILDEITRELSEALCIIWSEKDLEMNLKKLKSDSELKVIKKRIDSAQETLLELLIHVERFEKRVATGFYWLEDVAI